MFCAGQDRRAGPHLPFEADHLPSQRSRQAQSWCAGTQNRFATWSCGP